MRAGGTPYVPDLARLPQLSHQVELFREKTQAEVFAPASYANTRFGRARVTGRRSQIGEGPFQRQVRTALSDGSPSGA
jgi:hypothetical protein